jgi:hypothetical protein
MTNLSSACPGCASSIEKIDKFCQDCGLNLVSSPVVPSPVSSTSVSSTSVPSTPVPLHSPLLGRRTPSQVISRAASRGVNRLHVDESPRVWVRGLVGAETLLLLAMFAYSGYAMLWVEKSTPDLVSFGTTQKKQSHADQKTSTIAQVPETFSEEITELITQAKLLSRLRPAKPQTIAMRRRHHHSSSVETQTKTAGTTHGASWLKDDGSAHAERRSIAFKDPATTTSATNESTEKSSDAVQPTAEVTRADRDAESTVQAKETAQAKPTVQGKSPRPLAGRELSDVARYNKLLAGYFSRHHEDAKAANEPGASSEPPSFQEWVDSSKQVF